MNVHRSVEVFQQPTMFVIAGSGSNTLGLPADAKCASTITTRSAFIA